MTTNTLNTNQKAIMSPLTGTVIETVTFHTTDELNQMVETAKTAFESWSKKTRKNALVSFTLTASY